jgi:hypothetical protein
VVAQSGDVWLSGNVVALLVAVVTQWRCGGSVMWLIRIWTHHPGTQRQGSSYETSEMGCFVCIKNKKITKHAKLLVSLQSKISRNSKFVSQKNNTI